MRLIGAHVDSRRPLEEAAEREIKIIQMFLSNPQGWKKPDPREDIEELKASDVEIVVHSPYLINLCAGNNRIRIPSRKILNQTLEAAGEVDAMAVVVHGGFVSEDEPPELGIERWSKALAQVESDVPIYIENTASGDRAVAREVEMIGRLWEAIGDTGVGFCLDTCHAWAAGEPLEELVPRVMAATGRIDLLHCNGSRDPFDSRRDRHEILSDGYIPIDQIESIVAATDCPIILETPGDAKVHAAEVKILKEFTLSADK